MQQDYVAEVEKHSASKLKLEALQRNVDAKDKELKATRMSYNAQSKELECPTQVQLSTETV